MEWLVAQTLIIDGVGLAMYREGGTQELASATSYNGGWGSACDASEDVPLLGAIIGDWQLTRIKKH